MYSKQYYIMGMAGLNDLLSRLQVPYSAVFKDSLSIILDGRGRILDIPGKEHFRHKDLVELMEQHENVSEVFEPGESPDEFIIRREFNDIENTRDFYTDIPIITLSRYQMDGDRFLGVVRIPGFIPQFPFSTSNLVVFLDRDEKIRGLNRNLHHLLDRPDTDPYALLGRPVGGFFSPTPAEIQARFLADLRKARKRRLGHRESASVGPWRNDAGGHAYRPLPFTLNSATEDFRLVLKAKILKGQAPILVIGAPKTDTREPDYNGYMAGEAFQEAGYVFKKQGVVLIQKERGIVREDAEFCFSKTGRGLFLDINGRPVLEYYDPQFIHNALFRLLLGLRPGSAAVISEIAFEKGPTVDREKPFKEQEIVIRLKSEAERYFTLTTLPNIHLSVRYPHINGYLLSDVTAFHEKAELFRKQYREEKRRGEKLESLLTEYGRGRELFIGRSRDIGNIREKARVIAASSATVLIQGATGTGKEVLARYIHGQGQRRDGPFIKVDCSTLPSTLIESELFGYEKGAFTGALESRPGRFEQAQGGTLFLDEIGNLSLAFQAKLLTVLQDFAVTRLGGDRPVRLDIRLIAASNINLDAMVRGGNFREDLYYRLNTIQLILPPLACRREDIEPLCQHFIGEFNRAGDKNVRGLTADAYRRLYQHDWPGNIRELRNVIHQAHIFCETERITDKDLRLPQVAGGAKAARAPGAGNNHLKGLTRQKLVSIVKKNRGVVSDVARELCVTRKACYDNLRKFRVDLKAFRSS